ncbi:helix-turn-helix domain-containing protein [Acidobacteria bacterium AH-259-D05]|nr:helix-turn-helix domain-containing protein [Acidobacteria bacterium AH-259-D05]
MEDFDRIGRAVRFHRKKSGLSQLELANLAGVGKTVIFDVEKGKDTVRFSTLAKIFRVLNIRIRLESPLMDQFEETADEES